MLTTVDTRPESPQTQSKSAGFDAALAALKPSLGDPQTAVETCTTIVSSYESRLASSQAKLTNRDATIQSLQKRLRWLEEQFQLSRHRRFGPSSEKDAVQASLFDEVERTAADDERRRRAGGCGARQSPPPQTASPPRPNCHAKTWCMTWRTMPRCAPMMARRCAQSIGAAQRACPVQPGNRATGCRWSRVRCW